MHIDLCSGDSKEGCSEWNKFQAEYSDRLERRGEINKKVFVGDKK